MKQLLFSIALICISTFASAQYSNTKIQVGQKAPELAYADTSGNIVQLSDINKKRIVLIDFWASWCGPCRGANPGVVKMYNEYSKKKFKKAKKGFTVLSVSLDQQSAAWRNAIIADKLPWPYHMSDLKGWSSEAAAIYGVGYIPQCFLVDASGMVIGKYNKAEDAIADLQKLLK
jgi:thiol-disulfide isomerase/thioredoxin